MAENVSVSWLEERDHNLQVENRPSSRQGRDMEKEKAQDRFRSVSSRSENICTFSKERKDKMQEMASH